MEDIKSIEKLKNKFNISFEDAKIALERADGDILDATVYLEKVGKIKKPSVSTYFSNEYRDSTRENYKEESTNEEFTENKENKKETFYQGFFEGVCRFIDNCNNIFLKMKKHDNVIINLPLTVVVILLFFTFWIIVPCAIIALFFDMNFEVDGKNIESSKINHIFNILSDSVKKIKKEFKKGIK